jgi:hypothetical protein
MSGGIQMDVPIQNQDITPRDLLKIIGVDEDSSGPLSIMRTCAGVPNNAIGVDGDFMRRVDGLGGALVNIYVRVSGAYVGIC